MWGNAAGPKLRGMNPTPHCAHCDAPLHRTPTPGVYRCARRHEAVQPSRFPLDPNAS
jgi:hypothetical protein